MGKDAGDDAEEKLTGDMKHWMMNSCLNRRGIVIWDEGGKTLFMLRI